MYPKFIIVTLPGERSGHLRLGMIDSIDREFKDYTFWYTPFVGCPPNPLDMSHVKWI